MKAWEDCTIADIVTALRDVAGLRLDGKQGQKKDMVAWATMLLGPDADNPVFQVPEHVDLSAHIPGHLLPRDQPTVHEAMLAVFRDVEPIAKNLKNVQSGYSARSIDDVVDSLHVLMAKHGVFPVPTVLKAKHREVEVGKNRNRMREATLRVRYRFFGPRGDHVDSIVIGEALDSGDKSTNKAMSGALKYALLQVFLIPIGMNDADAETHERSAGEPMASLQSKKKIGKALSVFGDQAGDMADKVREKFGPSAELRESKVDDVIKFLDDEKREWLEKIAAMNEQMAKDLREVAEMDCSTCEGTGLVVVNDEEIVCPDCNGTKRASS